MLWRSLRDCHKVSLTQGLHQPRAFFLDGFLYGERNGLGCSLSQNSLSIVLCVFLPSAGKVSWRAGRYSKLLRYVTKSWKVINATTPIFDVLLSSITPCGSLLQSLPERYLIFSLSQIRGSCFTSFEMQARRRTLPDLIFLPSRQKCRVRAVWWIRTLHGSEILTNSAQQESR